VRDDRRRDDLVVRQPRDRRTALPGGLSRAARAGARAARRCGRKAMTTIPMRGACRVLWPVTMALALAACAGPQGARSVRAPAGEPAAAGAPASPPAARGGGYYLDDGPGANPP